MGAWCKSCMHCRTQRDPRGFPQKSVHSANLLNPSAARDAVASQSNPPRPTTDPPAANPPWKSVRREDLSAAHSATIKSDSFCACKVLFFGLAPCLGEFPQTLPASRLCRCTEGAAATCGSALKLCQSGISTVSSVPPVSASCSARSASAIAAASSASNVA